MRAIINKDDSKQHVQVPAEHRILLVDDEPDIRDALRDLLSACLDDVEVTTAASPEEARDAIAQRNFDLLITDYRMPGEDGLELLTSLHRDEAPMRVLMTAYPESDLAARAFARGYVQAFVSKPFEPEDVISLVSRLLRGPWSEADRDQALAATLEGLRRRTATE